MQRSIHFFALFFGLLAACMLTQSFAEAPDHNYKIENSLGLNSNRWFVSIGGGLDSVFFTNRTQFLNTTVNPLSPSDSFITDSSTKRAGMFTADAGYLLATGNDRYLNLFLEYDDFARIGANGTRLLFNINFPGNSSPYNYNIDRQAFLLGMKADITQWHWFLPYVEIGAGVSQNSFSGFYNNPINNQIVPFSDRTTDQVCFVVGLGMDWLFAGDWHWVLSAGYRYGYWGDVRSATQDLTVMQLPLPQPIRLSNTLYSNQGILKISYLFAD